MATIGMQLISHIIRTGNLTGVLDWGVTLEDFSGAEEKAMFDALMAYRAENGSVIGPNLLAFKFPNFVLCDDGAQMTTDALCQEVRNNRLRLEAKKVAETLSQNAAADVAGSLVQAQAKITHLINLSSSRKVDIHYADALAEISQDHDDIASGRYKPKGYWPWDPLNHYTMGYQEDDYIVLYGRPKSKKSFVLAYIIACAIESDAQVLIYTKEMTPKNLLKRVAGFQLDVPYQELRTGKLNPHQRDHLRHIESQAKSLRDKKNVVCLSAKDVASGGDTVSWLRAKVDRYKPDLVFVDGLYLMSPDGVRKNAAVHERMENVSRATRNMVLDVKTPLIATMQANRKAAQHQNAELDEVAFSDSVSQDATMLIRVIADKGQDTVSLVFGGSREFALHGIQIGGEPCTDFRFRQLLSAKETLKAKLGDTEEDEETSGAKSKKYGSGVRVQQTKTLSKEDQKMLDSQIKQMGM